MSKRVRKESAAFLAATFGATWLLWWGGYSRPSLVMLGTAVPSVMGLVLTLAFADRSTFGAMLRSALRIRAPRIWWLYATLVFPMVLLCASVVFAATGGTLPPAQFPLWFLPIAFLYIFACMGPLGEELGWRGFLLKRFLPEWGVAKSGLVLGFIWSAWHVPLFVIPGTIQHELANMGLPMAITGYFLYTVCISLLITVLYAQTDGNLLLCMVFHTVCNLSLGVAPIILARSGALILLLTLLLAAIIILKLAGRHRCSVD